MNTRFLAFMNPNQRYYFLSNVAIKNPKTDFKGLKFRTGPPYTPFGNALGLVGVTMPTGDIYTALQQKTIVGVGSVPDNIDSLSLFEVCKYWIEPGFWSAATPGLVNLDRWNTIPQNLQDLLINAATQVELNQYKFNTDNVAKLFAKFSSKGMQPITFSADDAKWYTDTANQAKWDEIKGTMTADEYTKMSQIFKR